jgi:hypothetical protein
VLAEVHARTEEDAERAVAEILAAYDIGEERPPDRPLLLDVVA